MRKNFLCIAISLSVPLFLFMNVWQSYRFMNNSFVAKGLIRSQGRIVKENKQYINTVAELESPVRVVELLESKALLDRIGGGEIIRIEIVDNNE